MVTRGMGRPVTYGFSIDVEEPGDAALLASAPGSTMLAEWETDALLGTLARYGRTATFFIVGNVAETYPGLVRRIAAAGHEVACHGERHVHLHDLGARRLADGLGRTRRRLQDLSGQAVEGFRAPTWSLDRRSAWAVDVLLEAGFRYDSSVFPMRTPLYGEHAAPATPYRLVGEAGALIELPPAVVRFGGLRLPAAGGIYWRVIPAHFMRPLLRRTQSPAVIYVHPWELDEGFRCPPGTAIDARLSMTFGRSRLARMLHQFLAETPVVTLGRLARCVRGPDYRLAPTGLVPVEPTRAEAPA